MKDSFGKKGIFFDVFLMIVFFVTFIVIVIISSRINTELKNTIPNQFAPNSTDYNNSLSIYTQGQTAFRGFNILSALLLIGSVIILVFSTFFLNSHPVYFWVFLFLNFILFLIVPLIANVYTQIIATDTLSSEAVFFGIPTTIIDKLPLVFLAVVLLVGIITWGKSNVSQNI